MSIKLTWVLRHTIEQTIFKLREIVKGQKVTFVGMLHRQQNKHKTHFLILISLLDSNTSWQV